MNTIRRRGRGPGVVDMKKAAFLIIGSSLFLTISCAQEGTGSSSSLNEEENSSVSQPTVSSEETVEEETLVLNVQIPTALEEGANLSIGSNLNNWDPSDEDYFASKVDDTHYRLTLSFPEERLPLEIEYKWTIQLPSFGAEDIWLGVEKASVNFMTQKMTLVADDDRMDAVIEEASRIAKKVEGDVKVKRLK